MTPLHVHGVRSAREYEQLHERMICNGRIAHPGLNWQNPWPCAESKSAFVSGGKWLVMCGCGNAPSAHPGWDVARCFECGAVYSAIGWPADKEAIAAELVLRPHPKNRAWYPGETVAALAAENILHGVVALQIRKP